MQIEKITEKDIADLVRIHGQSFPMGWKAKEFLSLLKNSPTLCLGAFFPQEEQALSGFILLQHVLQEAEIITLAVCPLKRHCGIGKALLGEAITLLRNAGAHFLFLEVSGRNKVALSLYRKSGFRLVGHRPAYYKHPCGSREAALSLRFDLGKQSGLGSHNEEQQSSAEAPLGERS